MSFQQQDTSYGLQAVWLEIHRDRIFHVVCLQLVAKSLNWGSAIIIVITKPRWQACRVSAPQTSLGEEARSRRVDIADRSTLRVGTWKYHIKVSRASLAGADTLFQTQPEYAVQTV